MEWIEGWSVREVMGGGSEDDDEEEGSEDGEEVDGEDEEVVQKAWDGLDLGKSTRLHFSKSPVEFRPKRRHQKTRESSEEDRPLLSSS